MATVYWIHKEEETDITTQGYVGYTYRDPKRREKEHQAGGREGIFEVIAEGTESEMLDLEKQLRPLPHIGDNVSSGGHRGSSKPKPEGFSDKIREARTGQCTPNSTRHKISETLKGKMMWITDGVVNEMVLTSQSIPAGYKRGRTQNMSGKNNGFFGKKHTEETKQKMRGRRNKK